MTSIAITNEKKKIGGAQQTAIVESVAGCELLGHEVPEIEGKKHVGMAISIKPFDEELMKPTGVIERSCCTEHRYTEKIEDPAAVGMIFGTEIVAAPVGECIVIAKCIIQDTPREPNPGKLTVV